MDFATAFTTGSGMKEKFTDETHSEPDFTKTISSKSICDFFYAFFWIYAILAGICLIAIVGIASMSKGMPWSMLFGYIISFTFASVTALFHYLICSRALLK